MCNCNKRVEIPKTSSPAPFAIPGESGFVYLRYTGQDAKTEYGSVTGARYPFYENPVRLVDSRDAEKLMESGRFQAVSNG